MGARQVWSDTPLIKIYIARHGETTWNVEGRIQGRSDPDLSPQGVAQSLALLEQLKDRPISAIYTSTLQRSILTAQPIAKFFALPIQKQPELDEIAFGIMEGVQIFSLNGELRKEWERFKENRFTYHIPGAENFTDVATRLKPFKEKILRDHRGQEILIIGHMIVNRFLIGMLLEYPLEEIQRVEQHNGCVYLVERNGEARVFYFIDGEIREGFFFAPPKDPLERRRRL
jgi:broad specificity phosphatase PhoE